MIQTFEPIQALCGLVDYIWVMDFEFLEDNYREDIIMPLGHVNLIFNYGSRYSLVEQDLMLAIPDVAIIGQMKRAKHVRYGQRLQQMGVSLTPLGYIQIFGEPGIALTERIVQASDVGAGTEELYQELKACPDIEQQITAVHQYLLQQLTLNKGDTARIESMLSYVEQAYEDLSIANMAKAFQVSVSTLERFFKKWVGLTPKAYGDIVKFRKHAEDKGLRENMQDHYYDQSHLIKTSKRFAGKTVKELEKLQHELTLRYVWQDES